MTSFCYEKNYNYNNNFFYRLPPTQLCNNIKNNHVKMNNNIFLLWKKKPIIIKEKNSTGCHHLNCVMLNKINHVYMNSDIFLLWKKNPKTIIITFFSTRCHHLNYVILNKRKGQSRINNPERLATLGIPDTRRR